MAYMHPGDSPAPDMPGQLSASDLAWLTRLSSDPAGISLEDGQVLAGMSAALPAGSADRRLVDSIWLPVKQLHDTAQAAADNPAAASGAPTRDGGPGAQGRAQAAKRFGSPQASAGQ